MVISIIYEDFNSKWEIFVKYEAKLRVNTSFIYNYTCTIIYNLNYY